MKPAWFASDASWLLGLCAARLGFATMFTVYSAALTLLRADWAMSAGQAGLVPSAYHLGFLLSLFSVGFLSDHYGAKRVYLWSSLAAAASGMAFALFADDFTSGALL